MLIDTLTNHSLDTHWSRSRFQNLSPSLLTFHFRFASQNCQ